MLLFTISNGEFWSVGLFVLLSVLSTIAIIIIAIKLYFKFFKNKNKIPQ